MLITGEDLVNRGPGFNVRFPPPVLVFGMIKSYGNKESGQFRVLYVANLVDLDVLET
jgi:hypothetical protein